MGLELPAKVFSMKFEQYPRMIGFNIPRKVPLIDPWKFSPSKVSHYAVVLS